MNSKELVISSTRHETRVAILEDDQLVEIYFQRANEYSLAGSIHKGRVTRVLPGMQSAFVDLGLERDTFLYVSDFFEENEDFDPIIADDKPARSARIVQAVTPVQTAAAPASEEIPVDGQRLGTPEADSRDRRGRRSRRRRGRGRGFPDAKYADGVEQTADSEPGPAEPEEDLDPIVLPGESLAKYSAARQEQSLGREDAPASDSETQSDVAVAFPETSYVEPVLTTALKVSEEDEDEEQVPAVVPLPGGTDQPEEEPEPVETLAAADELPGYSAAEDRAIEELEAEVAAAEAEDSGRAAEELAHADLIDGAAPAAGSGERRSADLREREGRYLQRGGRRMRRRGRGGERDRDRDRSPAGDLIAAAPPASAVTASSAAAAAAPRRAERTEKPGGPSISDLLREGQEIIVQIAKEPLGQKGARITSHIALPGRFVVYMPSLEHLGVSRKIASDEERQRLKRILQANRNGLTGGYIVRTAGEGRSEEEIAADMTFLYNLWLDIRQKAEKRPAPLLLHHDLEIVQRVLRDQLTESFKAVWVDTEEMYESVLRFMQRFQPALVNRVKMYTRPAPVFDAFNITSELEKALRPKVWLKSGGYIVINQTEALVAIDVNTGKYVGKSNRLEDTITKTNTEAVKEIVRQIRLRDLGGIIVVDFIDMDERKNRQKVMQVLEEAMRADKAPYKILQFNDFGLVAITRKRVKQSLERTLCSPCPACEGSGYVKSVQTVVTDIITEAHKIRNVVEGKNVVLRTHPEVAKFLKQHTNKYLEELEEVLGRPVLVTSDPSLTQEKFDLT